MASHRKGPAEHRYTIVQVRVWTDEKTSQWGMPPPHPLTLFTWLLTCPFTLRVPGVVAAGRAAMAEALGWDLVDFDGCFSKLEEAGLALADWKARLVYLPGAFRQQENRPSSPPSAATWKRELANAPECDLLRRIFADVRALLATMNTAFSACFEAGGRADWELPTSMPRELPSGYLAPAPAPAPAPALRSGDLNNSVQNSISAGSEQGSGSRAGPRALPPREGTQMVIPGAVSPPAKAKPKVQRAPEPALPDWLPADVWSEWVEHRKASKHPLTAPAVRQHLRELDKLRAEGQDPAAVIRQSIGRGWRGLFAVKDEGRGGRPQMGVSNIHPDTLKAYDEAF